MPGTSRPDAKVRATTWWALAGGLVVGTVGGWFVQSYPQLLWPAVLITTVFTMLEYSSIARLHRCQICGGRASEMLPRLDIPKRAWWTPVRARDHIYVCARDLSIYLNLEARLEVVNRDEP